MGYSDRLPVSKSVGTENKVCRVLGRTRGLTFRRRLLAVRSSCSVLSDRGFQAFFSRCSITMNSAKGLKLDVNVVDMGLNFGISIRVSTSTGR